jgi:hypothetical protein
LARLWHKLCGSTRLWCSLPDILWLLCVSHLYRELKRARHIGSFESEEDAARAYDREALKMLGSDAGLNFRESRCCMR